MKKLFSIIIVLAVIFLSACNTQTVPNPEQTENPNSPPPLSQGGVLKIGMREPDTLNPLLTKKNSCALAYDLIFDSLINIGKDMKPFGNLATKWEFFEDGKKIKIYLKENVRWHDGDVFSAADVKYTIETLKQNETIYDRTVNKIESVAVDGNAIELTLTEPNSSFIERLTFPIVPKHVSNLEEKPIGTGQFVFAQMTDKKNMTLLSNTNYHLGTPSYDWVSINFFSSDATTMSAFMSGELSMIDGTNVDFNNFTLSEYMHLEKYPRNSYHFLGLNHKNSMFENEKIRLAISMGIDRNLVAEDAFLKSAVVTNIPINSQSYLYSSDLDAVSFEPDKAKEFIAEAQTELKPFKILVNEENGQRLLFAQRIVDSLKTIGFDVSLKKVSWDDYTKALDSKNYDAFIGEFDLASQTDFDFFLKSVGAKNVFNYESAVMDMHLEIIKKSTSEENLIDSVRKFTRFFTQNQPIVGLCFENGKVVFGKKVGNRNIYSDRIYKYAYLWQEEK